jgi:integrase/recombinase XerD
MVDAEAHMAQRMTVSRLWSIAWEQNWQRMASAPTAKSCMANVLRILGPKRVPTLTTDDLERYVRRRSSEGAAAGSIKRELGIFRSILRWGCDRRNGGSRPLVDRTKIPVRWPALREHQRERVLTTAEIALLRNELEPWALRVFDALLHTGARCREILGAQASWLDREAGVLRLPAAAVKEREAKILLLPQGIVGALAASEGRLFGRGPSVTADYATFVRRLRSASARAGLILDVTPHDLRRTFASLALRAGVPLEHVAQVLGHRSIQTTRRYARLDETSRRAVTDAVSRVLG